MIRVTIELLPYGGIEGRKILATLDIANISGTFASGNYYAKLYEEEDSKLTKELTYEQFSRKRGALTLVYEILKRMVKKVP